MHLPSHFDFQDLRLTPSQTRVNLAGMGHQNIVAYQPHHSLPRIDEELLEKAMEDVDGILLLQLAVGLAKLGDVDHYTRIHLYKALVERYSKPDRVLLSLLPLVTVWPGPQNLGRPDLPKLWANHMIVSGNHASPDIFTGSRTGDNHHNGQDLVVKYGQELGVKMVPEQKHDQELSNVPERAPAASIFNPPVVNEHPNNGRHLPGLTIQREIAEILAEAYPPRHKQGVCIWFTGLSGSGKSTTAEMLTWLLLEHGRRVTVLDGDVVRTHLSKGLGFSKADRDTNVRRIGFVASELVRLGGVVICAVVSPYRVARNDVRNMVGVDQFVEVFVTHL
jgi:sulfate adenylyltransferase